MKKIVLIAASIFTFVAAKAQVNSSASQTVNLNLSNATVEGVDVELAYRFEPQVVLDAFAEHRPTYTIGAITAFNAMLHAPGFSKDHFTSFTSIYSGGAAISPTAEQAFFAATGKQVHNAYGLTETTSPMTVTPFGSPSPVDPT